MRFRPFCRPKLRVALAAMALACGALTACGGSSQTPPPLQSTPTSFRITSLQATGILPEAMANAPYSYSFNTNAGQSNIKATPPVTFSATNLPPGLTMSAEGVLSGTPQTPGGYSFVVNATDSSPTPVTTGASLRLNVATPGVTLTQVAQTSLGNHGQNAAVEVATASASGIAYAYVGTRGSAGDCPATGVKIVNLSQISNPQMVAAVGGVAGASEARPHVLTGISSPAFHAGSEGDLLAIPLRPCNPQAAEASAEGLEFYDVTDPAHPAPLGTWQSGESGVSDVALVATNGHLYALAAVPGSETQTGVTNPEGDLRVLDITDPTQPREIGNWGLLQATGTLVSQLTMGQDQRIFLDTLHLSQDGKTAYLAYWDGGVVMLNVSDPTAIHSTNAAILLNHLQYPVTAQATSTTPSQPEGNTHFALPIDDGAQLLVTDEICASGTPLNPALAVVCGPQNSATLSSTSGWGYLRTYGLQGPSSTTLGGFYITPGSVSAPAPDNGIYTAHDIAWNGDSSHPHAYVAWYSSGVVDLDLSNVAAPTLLANFIPPDTPDPNGNNSGVDNPAKALVYGVASLRQGGQPYVLASDINTGLWILQETPAPGLSLLTTSLPDGTMGVPYQAELSAANGALGSSSITFSVPSNSNPLPPGLNLAANGSITGTPLASGSTTVTFQASDSLGHTTQQTLTLTVNDNLAVLPPSPIPLGTVGEPYSVSLGAVNGTVPYTFSIAGGTLPQGLNLSSAGVISGTPAFAGISNLTLQVSDSTVPALTATLPLSLQVSPLNVANPSLDKAVVGSSYAFSVAMANGVGPYSPIVVEGSLPPGLAVSAGSDVLSKWLISGTPTTAGSYNFSVLISDSYGQSTTQAFTLVVNPFEATPVVLASGRESYGYHQELTMQGGASPYLFSLVTGTLPAGLSLDAQNGTLQGVPAPGSAGTYPFRLQIQDHNGLTAQQDFSLSIFTGYSFAITTPILTPAVVGTAYSQAIAADYGATPYTLTRVGGTLPPGLTLSPNGILSGTPSAAGSYSFQVQATDANGQRVSQSIRLTVEPPNSPL